MGLGDTIIVHSICNFNCAGDVGTPTDTLGNVYLQKIHFGAANNLENIWTTTAPTANGGSVSVTVPKGSSSISYVFSVDVYSFVAGIGTGGQDQPTSSAASGSDTLTLTINPGSMIYETFMVVFGNCATVSAGSGQSIRDLYCYSGQNVETSTMDRLYPNGGSVGSIGSWSGATGNGQVQHAAIELLATGGAATGGSTQTLCFGNCGTPAITLVNSNATHTVNFNQTITLLYIFQSTLNGFLNNVTINVAKPYPSGFQIGLAWYTASCASSVTPFTSACPGLQQGQKVNFVFNKGRDVLFGNGQQAALASGTWVGLGVTASLSGLDLNNTNALCQPNCFQAPTAMVASNGFVPATVTGTTVCASAGSPCNVPSINSVGLWAWITGQTSTVPTPVTPTGPCVNNFAQLDCLLPAMSNGLCAVITVSCQTSASLFWIFVLTFLSFMLVTVGFASAHVTKFVAAGDVFVFFFLGWFFIFVGVNLIVSFVTIFFLFMGAVVFAKTARNYF